MGWGSGSEIFNDMAGALIDVGASDEVITKTLTKTISNLRGEDWDTYDESLDLFSDTPAVVEAFRQNEIYLEYCWDVQPTLNGMKCRNEKGHDGDHKDRWDETWPNPK